jgi:hypothetical protein
MNKQFIGNDFTKTSQSIDKLSPDKVSCYFVYAQLVCNILVSNAKLTHNYRSSWLLRSTCLSA